jgi:hypothetical protein
MMTIQRCEVDYVVLRTSTSPRRTPCRQQGGGNSMSEATLGNRRQHVPEGPLQSDLGGERVVVRHGVLPQSGATPSSAPGLSSESCSFRNGSTKAGFLTALGLDRRPHGPDAGQPGAPCSECLRVAPRVGPPPPSRIPPGLLTPVAREGEADEVGGADQGDRRVPGEQLRVVRDVRARIGTTFVDSARLLRRQLGDPVAGQLLRYGGSIGRPVRPLPGRLEQCRVPSTGPNGVEPNL